MSTNTQDKPCNCFNENLERVKNHLNEKGKVPEGAIDVDFRWQGQAFLLTQSDYAPVNPKVEAKFRAPKKGGGHARNMSKLEISLMATHCCFCGRKYQRNE
tara:strand:+ start:304 stop:606 length:303 start_codon:yes stop_codon:yes gene_type:complete